jgi:hypothetical protein
MINDPQKVIAEIAAELEAFHHFWEGDDDEIELNAESAIATLAEITSILAKTHETPVSSQFISSRFDARL